jgi:glycyl-tRNA synthetase beta chain
MTTNKNLLVELLVEELPPKSLKKISEAFATALTRELSNEGLLESESITTSYASPRRLAAHITNVREKAPTKRVRKKLMPVSVAFEEGGKPSAALRKKIDKENFSIDNLIRAMEGNTEYVFLDFEEVGLSISPLLHLALRSALNQLSIPKVMSYQLQDGWTTVSFVRPAHKLVVLHGSNVIDIDALGLQAGRETQGHRFEASMNPVVLKSADSYAQQLETEGAVIASFTARRDEILKQITDVAAREKLTPVGDDDLLDEVTALVERPNVLVGKFEKEFLEVPQECLILTMKANQKYFPLLDSEGKLTNRFLIVSNIRPADASLVIGGNERVVRPRLADAKFFFHQDRKKPLDSRVLGLAKVVYHNKLGSQGDRVGRVQAIARIIGHELGNEVLTLQADQAALLAKADLLTDMVGEFPELQGIMGRYYAKHDGLSDDIAFAIEDHYKPRFSGDELPRNMVGICVALADKLETLIGMFGIGEFPTGDKDPFALRRHALGVIRMLIEKDLNLSIDKLVQDSFTLVMLSVSMTLGPNAKGTYVLHQDTAVSVLNFIYERLSGYLKEQGYNSQEVDAVLSLRPQRLAEVSNRLAAVRAFAALPEAAALAAANKRVGNILKKEGIVASAETANSALLKEPAEKALHLSLGMIAPKADSAFAAGDYTTSLQTLAALREPVDAFFDNVMVNTEDAALRTNRLALLAQLHRAMNRVADISKLAA